MRLYNYITILFSFTLFLISCSSEDIIIPAEEPNISNSIKSVIEGDFSIQITISDRVIEINWKPVIGASTYEVILNDIIVSYDIMGSDEKGYYYCMIHALTPETQYKIAVRALDKEFNVKIVSGVVTTMKSFFDEVIQIPFDKYKYDTTNGHLTAFTKTSDNGFVVVGSFMSLGGYYTVIIKLNSVFEVEWTTDIGDSFIRWGSFECEVKECENGYLIVRRDSAIMVSKSGNFIWQWDETLPAYSSLVYSGLELPDRSIILVGAFFDVDPYKPRPWIAKLDQNGTLLWRKSGGDFGTLEKVIYKGDGKLFAGGTIYDYSAYLHQTLTMLVEFDTNGDILNEHIYKYDENAYESTFVDVVPGDNNCYYVIGNGKKETDPYNINSTFIVKIEENGSILWKKTGDESDSYGYASGRCYKVNNSSIALVYYIGYSNVGILIVDSEGSIEWRYNMPRFPNFIYFGQDELNRYMYVTEYGEIIFMNFGGYTDLIIN